MTLGPSGRGVWRGLLRGALAAAWVTGCAQGAEIGQPFQESGDGGDSGDGGRRNDGGGRGDGGRSSGGDGDGDGGDHGPSSSNAGSTASSSNASASASASESSASASSASSSAAQSVAASSSASTGGGPLECNAPLDPAPDCGAGQHCFPTNQGGQPVCSDAGNVGQYGGCNDATECGPILGCVEVAVGEVPCCLQFCTGDLDCPGYPDDGCFFFTTPQYAGGVQYGVCYDGLPIGCG